MLRRSKITLKFATQYKLSLLNDVFDEYKSFVNKLINTLWEKPLYYRKTKYLDKAVLAVHETWLSERLKQAAGKQALQIIRSQINNPKTEKFKPEFTGKVLDLDERFVSLTLSDHADTFDAWLHLQSLGNRIILDLPVKFNKHYNKYQDWTRKKSIRIIRHKDTFEAEIIFEKITPEPKENGEILGIDIGINKLISTSTGEFIGTEIKRLIEKLHRRKQKSHNWYQTVQEIKNYIGESVNKIDLTDVKILVMEQLTGLSNKKTGKNNKTTRKLLGYWNRVLLETRIQLRCQINRVKVVLIEPAYTSQECSSCHHISQGNRHGENFQCVKCGHTLDADFNASLNIRDRYRLPIVAYS